MSQKIINTCRKIVAEKECQEIDGIIIDLFSASAILKVYDGLSSENKDKFLSVSIGMMADIAFKVINNLKREKNQTEQTA